MKKHDFKKPHYFVPPCPECGSRCTGRYVRKPLIESWYMEEQSLRNAEIIRFVKKEPIKNCFCVDCGAEWGQTIYAKLFTESEIEEDRIARGTKEAYEEIRNDNQAMLKKRKKNPGVRIFHWIFG